MTSVTTEQSANFANFASTARLAESALHIKNVSAHYEHTQALTDICLNVREGEFLGIIGPNGGGKSSLLKAILGLIQPTSGSIEIFGKANNINRSLIGYVPQFSDVDRRFPISVQEVAMTALLKHGLHPFFRFSKDDKNFAYAQLERMEIADLATRQIAELSGGEFQRLLIARALTTKPRILLLDEPTASVDPSSSEHIYTLLSELAQNNITIILVTHDLLAVSPHITSIACLNQRLVYHGAPSLTEPIMTQLYGCPVELIAHGSLPHRVLQCHHGEGC